jgi:hypothetical protein
METLKALKMVRNVESVEVSPRGRRRASPERENPPRVVY